MGTGRLVLPATVGGVAAGILVADVLAGPSPIPAVVGGCAALVLGRVVRIAAALVVAVALLGLGLGLVRGSSNMEPTGPSAEPSVAALVGTAEHELVGTVVDDPRPREDRLQLVLSHVAAAADGGPWSFRDRLLVWLPRGLAVSAGDLLAIRSKVELAEDFEGFAYREYLARQGIGAIARARSAHVVRAAGGPAAVLAGLRSTLLGGLNDLVPEPEAALGAGILLGVRTSIAPEVNDAFATAGLTHVVAISGWNIAIVAAMVAAAVRPLARRPGGRWTTAAAGAATVGGYVLLTGASPSVVRAALMAGCMLVARLGGSRAHAASALGLAALLMLLAAPSVLWDVGFQLSLLATAGLIWFGGPIERRLVGWPGWIREPVALTLAAQLTTLPVILVNFERLSLVAPLANVLVVPWVPVAMLFSAIASVVGAAHPPLVGEVLAWFAGGAAWLTLRVITWLGTTVAAIPHAAVDVSVPPALAIAWFPLLGLGSWALRRPSPTELESNAAKGEPGRIAMAARRVLRPIPVVAVLAAILLAITAASAPDGRLHVTTLDVGQGDAILVETSTGRTMLVDGGPDPELTLRRIGANLPFHVRSIDVMVLSHPHQDHVAGLVEVARRFEVRLLLHAGIPFENPSFERLLADAEAGRLPVLLARAGQRFALDAATSFEVLYPTEADATAPLPDGDINNGSLVVRLEFHGFSALLTGDAEAPVESALVARGALQPADLLKVGHHGSHSSTTAAFVDAVGPSIAVISAGDGNEYGHPARETLATLAARPGAPGAADRHRWRRRGRDGRTRVRRPYRCGMELTASGARPERHR